MRRDYRRWYSPRLHRDAELLIFGHAGAKVLMFPTRDGRFWEYETLNVVASLAGKANAGHLQLYRIEGLAQETPGRYAACDHAYLMPMSTLVNLQHSASGAH